jgi:adenylate cyclase
VMDRLVTCVHRFDGGVVDYAGDGFLAMWNAPAAQPNHAALAARAALAMLAELPRLQAESWPAGPNPLGLGVGLNTGPALVGNVGSRFRFKYGPLGHTVNLASRVEGATKMLEVPALVTTPTRAALGDGFAVRRLGRFRVAGIAGEVELHELYGEDVGNDWFLARDAYEKSLALFEAGRWAEARDALAALHHPPADQPDFPTLDLITRVLDCLRDPPESFDPVKELRGK